MTLPTYQQLADAQAFIDSLPVPTDSNVVVIDESNSSLVEFIEQSTKNTLNIIDNEIEHHISTLRATIETELCCLRVEIEEYINKNAQELIKNK